MAGRKRADDQPDASDAHTMVERWRRLDEQLECPHCGTGRLPESRFCLRCGHELPPIEREDSPEVVAQKRPGRRAVNWLYDTFPSVAAPRALAASVAGLLLAGGLWGLAIRHFAGGVGKGKYQAIGTFLVAISIGALACVTHMTAVGWLFAGELAPPWEALPELRLRHWLAAVLVTVLVIGLAALIA